MSPLAINLTTPAVLTMRELVNFFTPVHRFIECGETGTDLFADQYSESSDVQYSGLPLG